VFAGDVSAYTQYYPSDIPGNEVLHYNPAGAIELSAAPCTKQTYGMISIRQEDSWGELANSNLTPGNNPQRKLCSNLVSQYFLDYIFYLWLIRTIVNYLSRGTTIDHHLTSFG